MIPVSVLGIGLWLPGVPTAAALDLEAQPEAAEPPAVLLEGPLRRRAGRLSRIAAEVVGQAARDGGANLAATPSVYGSVHGELQAAVQMMRSFTDGEGLPSPTTFHNSVHNTPAGYLSIATRSHASACALSAGPETSALAFLDAICRLDGAGGDALVVLLDEPVPEPFGQRDAFPAAGVAFHLRAGSAPGARAVLDELTRGEAPAAPLPHGLERHPCAGGFALCAAVLRGHRGFLSLAGGASPWRVRVGGAPA